MGWINKLVNKVKALDDRLYSATVNACLYMASCDGEIEDAEVDQLITALQSNEQFAPFKSRIPATVAEFRNGVKERGILMVRNDAITKLRELEDLSDRETVLLMALTIAYSDGEVEEKEVKVAGEIAKALSLSLNRYL